MRPPRRDPGFVKRLLRFRSGRRAEPKWHSGQVSQEERIAAVLIVVLLTMLFGTACVAYVLNRENARVSAGATGGVSAASRAGAPKDHLSGVFPGWAASGMNIVMPHVLRKVACEPIVAVTQRRGAVARRHPRTDRPTARLARRQDRMTISIRIIRSEAVERRSRRRSSSGCWWRRSSSSMR